MLRCGALCDELVNAARQAGEGLPYFSARRARLQMNLDLMQRRSLEVFQRYEDLRHVIDGMAAVRELIEHLEKLEAEHAFHPAWGNHFRAAVAAIPAQIQGSAEGLKNLGE